MNPESQCPFILKSDFLPKSLCGGCCAWHQPSLSLTGPHSAGSPVIQCQHQLHYALCGWHTGRLQVVSSHQYVIVVNAVFGHCIDRFTCTVIVSRWTLVSLLAPWLLPPDVPKEIEDLCGLRACSMFTKALATKLHRVKSCYKVVHSGACYRVAHCNFVASACLDGTLETL